MKRRRYIPAFLCHYSGKLSAAYLLQYIFQPLYRIKDIMSDELILVDEHDNTLGYDEKLRVHQLSYCTVRFLYSCLMMRVSC